MNFQNKANKLVQQYVASIPFDQRLYRQDIEGSIAHAKMLAKQGIIAGSEAETIIKLIEEYELVLLNLKRLETTLKKAKQKS